MKTIYNKLFITILSLVCCCSPTLKAMEHKVDLTQGTPEQISRAKNRMRVLMQHLEPSKDEHKSIPNHIDRALAVWTDVEADDGAGIGLLLQYLRDNGIKKCDHVMFGVLLSNQYRKKELVKNLLARFGYTTDNVYAGTGGIKEPFEEEGKNILSAKMLEQFLALDKNYLQSNDPRLYQDDESIVHFRKMLEHAAPNSIDVVLITNPIDFMKAIDGNVELFSKINTISMMGGWFNNKPSFNWALSMDSVLELFALMEKVKGHKHSPTMTVFSSHFFAQEFNGYVNQKKFPEVIHAFDNNSDPIVDYLRHMVKNWDDSMTVIKKDHDVDQKKWRLEMVDRIGKENIGRQFAPADPATMLGYLYPEEFITKKTPSSLRFSTDTNSQGKKSFSVECTQDSSSNVYIVEKVNMSFFNDKLCALMNTNYGKRVII